jgi:hypothetical protein
MKIISIIIFTLGSTLAFGQRLADTQKTCRTDYFMATGPDCYHRAIGRDRSASASILFVVTEICQDEAFHPTSRDRYTTRGQYEFYCSDTQALPSSQGTSDYVERRVITNFKNIAAPTNVNLYQMYFRFPINNKLKINGAFHFHYFLSPKYYNAFIPVFNSERDGGNAIDDYRDQIYLTYPERFYLNQLNQDEQWKIRDFNLTLQKTHRNLDEFKCSIHPKWCTRHDERPENQKEIYWRKTSDEIFYNFSYRAFMRTLSNFYRSQKLKNLVPGKQRISNRIEPKSQKINLLSE